MPGLPDYIALNDCAEIFANSETFRKGRLLDYPADWGTTNVDRIAALGLNFTSVPGGCGGAMVAEMKAAEAPDEPLLVMFWSPHLIAALVDLHPVSLPAYEEGCQDDPSVGVNPNAAWSRSQRVSNFLRPVNDTLQSTPLFVILIPFLMFFFSKRGIHFLSGNHRLRHRPDHSLYRAWFAQRAERNRGGGEVHGQHPRQLLWEVKKPLAIPEIMLGQSVYIALSKADAGSGWSPDWASPLSPIALFSRGV